jgi:uncharacterized protein YceK
MSNGCGTHVYCIVGLPGSGKTFLANKMASSLKNNYWPKVCIFDDIKNILDLPENDVFDTIIIVDPYFCLTDVREMADAFLTNKYSSSFTPVVEWLFFENNKEKCLKNVKHRDDGRKVEGLIKLFHTEYIISNDIIPKEIWQQDGD